MLGIVDESSVASQDMLNHDDYVGYSFKDDNGDAYRVLETTTTDEIILPTNTSPASQILGTITPIATSTVSQLPQQFYVISSGNAVILNNGSRKLLPKLPAQSSQASVTVQHPPAAPQKKRDERRRATHNEVERRRRDKINHWIMKLGSIIPVDGLPGGELSRPNVANAEGQSKGGILSKACEYITMLQENYSTMSECLKDSDIIQMENEKLHEANSRLRKENEFLKAQLLKQGIRTDDSDGALENGDIALS